LLLLLDFVLEKDISNDNTGVFRGIKDNGLWEGGNSKATIGVGNRLTIEAATLTEVNVFKKYRYLQ